jgi:hypothetical protein
MSMEPSQAEYYAIPPRVRAAMDFIEHLERARHQCEPTTPVRELSSAELAVERQALQMLGQYFSGEMDFGDRPVRAVSSRRTDEDPDAPVETPV